MDEPCSALDPGSTLRIEETKNKQTKGVNFAKDYLIVP
jgi:ABC-type phosphate transport system ATPase subunit